MMVEIPFLLRCSTMQGHAKVSSPFYSACRYASQGGEGGYERVGKLFVWHTVAKTATDRLVELLRLASGDKLALLRWVYENYPEHLKLIPAKKYDEFFRGISWCALRLASLIHPRRKQEQAKPLLDRLQASMN